MRAEVGSTIEKLKDGMINEADIRIVRTEQG